MLNTSHRREFLRTMGLGAAALAADSARAAAERPNILFILADDLGYGDLGCYNPESKIPTPALDRLAGQGVRFTDAHSPSSVCTPTRYGIMTGRYCWRSRLKRGVLEGYSPALIEPGRLTVASMLKKQGYHTGGVGKWHLGLGSAEKTDYSRPLRPGPNDCGFDYFFGIPASLDMPPYLYIENGAAVEQPTKTIEGQGHLHGAFWRGGPIAPGFTHAGVLPTLTTKANAFLRDHAAKRRRDPFFLYFPLTAPHTPWMPSDRFRSKSKAGEYGDFVAMTDEAVGQILRTVDELGMARNTLVLFASDNGSFWPPEHILQFGHRSNGLLRGQKADIWDGGHRIPFMARWPGKIAPGTTSNQTACLTDVMATAAEAAGCTVPRDAGEDSYSMLPAMLGERKPIREATVHHSANGHFSLRKGEWKLHTGRGSGGFTQPAEYKPKEGEPEGELFNLTWDPREAVNFYQQYPHIVKELTALLEKYQRQGYSRP